LQLIEALFPSMFAASQISHCVMISILPLEHGYFDQVSQVPTRPTQGFGGARELLLGRFSC
jgi:hypothetical protein